MKMQKNEKATAYMWAKVDQRLDHPGSGGGDPKVNYYQEVHNKSLFYVEWITRITLFPINLLRVLKVVTQHTGIHNGRQGGASLNRGVK
jgi:hypothetical protein